MEDYLFASTFKLHLAHVCRQDDARQHASEGARSADWAWKVAYRNTRPRYHVTPAAEGANPKASPHIGLILASAARSDVLPWRRRAGGHPGRHRRPSGVRTQGARRRECAWRLASSPQLRGDAVFRGQPQAVPMQMHG